MKKKYLGVVLTVLALFVLAACTSLSGKYYKINENSSGAYEGFDDDTYFNFTDKSFTAISDGNEEATGVIDNDKSTLTSGQFVLTYTLKDGVLTVTDGKDTAKYVQKDSDLYHSLSKKNIAKKNAEREYESAKSDYDDALEKLSKRILRSFLSKVKGSWKDSSVEFEITDSKVTVKDKYSTKEYNILEALPDDSYGVVSDSYGLRKFDINTTSSSDDVVEQFKDNVKVINEIEDWDDYVKETNSHELIISFAYSDGSTYSGEVGFNYDESNNTLKVIKTSGHVPFIGRETLVKK